MHSTMVVQSLETIDKLAASYPRKQHRCLPHITPRLQGLQRIQGPYPPHALRVMVRSFLVVPRVASQINACEVLRHSG